MNILNLSIIHLEEDKKRKTVFTENSNDIIVRLKKWQESDTQVIDNSDNISQIDNLHILITPSYKSLQCLFFFFWQFVVLILMSFSTSKF